MNPVIRRSVVRQVVLGLVLGSAISVIPIEISLLGAGAALTFLCLRRFWIGLSIAWLVCFVAVQLPLHRLERKIGPFAYGPISVAELIQKLRDEQGVPLMVIDDELKRNAIVFSASSRVTRREVIEACGRNKHKAALSRLWQRGDVAFRQFENGFFIETRGIGRGQGSLTGEVDAVHLG